MGELITAADVPQSREFTDENLSVLPVDLGAAGYDPSEFEKAGVFVHDLSKEPFKLHLDTIKPLEEEGVAVLVGMLDVSGSIVKIHALRKDDGTLNKNIILLGSADSDPNKEVDLSQAQPMQDVILRASDEPSVFGRESGTASRLGIDKSEISRKHFSIQLTKNGELEVQDAGSLNGTELLHAGTNNELNNSKSSEFMIGTTNYTFEGVSPTNGREPFYVFRSTDETGKVRRFFVYRSNSEGSLRSSQGFEADGRYMKGPELSEFFQYTQDTQLHPSLTAAIDEIKAKSSDPRHVDLQDMFYAEPAAEVLLRDAESYVKYQSIAGGELAQMLVTIPAGGLTEAAVIAGLGAKPGKTSKVFSKFISKLNDSLEKSGIIPDFSQPPKAVEQDSHPLLGNIVREVYENTSNGQQLEWHMSSDGSGRVWIERIRFADSEATPYGTDEKMAYSGLLTSKPLEYPEQATVVKTDKSVGNYKDISEFLDTLAPVKRYRAQRGVQRS